MITARRRSALASVLVLLWSLGGQAISVARAGTVTQETPYTVWSTRTGGLDAIGSWIWLAPLSEGSLALPEYAYSHTFSFLGREPGGAIALGSIGSDKVAGFATFDAAGGVQQAVMRFDWKFDRYYFPLVYQPADGFVAAAIYDASADTWTHVAAFAVPIEWGRLSSTSVTWASSLVPRETCADYPKAVALRIAPVGVDGDQIIHDSTPTTSGKAPGKCAASVQVSASTPAVAQYLFGAVMVP